MHSKYRKGKLYPHLQVYLAPIHKNVVSPVPWNYKIKSGKTMWIELIEHYNKGITDVKNMQSVWKAQKSKLMRSVLPMRYTR
jgi:alpha-glucuronidase